MRERERERERGRGEEGGRDTVKGLNIGMSCDRK